MTACGRVLVVEDDATIAEVVCRYLEIEGYSVEWQANGSAGCRRALEDPPDLLLLDVMLPGLDGFEICRRLRTTTSIPIIMLTARGDEFDRVSGLELGADDYVTKPFSPRELIARVGSVLRRARAAPASDAPRQLESGGIVVDVVARTVERDGEGVRVTAREFELLAFLMQHPATAFRRDELLERVWGYSYGDASTVTVHIRRLREKLEVAPSRPRLIGTVWGVGYRWDGDEGSVT